MIVLKINVLSKSDVILFLSLSSAYIAAVPEDQGKGGNGDVCN